MLYGISQLIAVPRACAVRVRDEETTLQPSATSVFGKAAVYFELMTEVFRVATRHKYQFLDDELFQEWLKSDYYTVSECNRILALELVDKAHLAAVASLLRTRRWADAVVIAHEQSNVLAWASAVRGLLENAGDILDGLGAIPMSLARIHGVIRLCLSGKSKEHFGFSELEHMLDHFVLAKWIRVKKGEASVLKSKDNAEYIRQLEPIMPGAVDFYHRLCSITHPSADSINWLYALDPGMVGGLKLIPDGDLKAIEKIASSHPGALQDMLMVSCNVALLILRVLHKFDVHPQLAVLKNIKWSGFQDWARVEQILRS
jgi:hypothetical protein